MTNMFCESAFFGVVISLLAYELGMLLKKKFGLPIFNPLLISIAVVIVFLAVFDIDYQNYNDGAKYLSYLLTPATVCLAIPLYEQMEALKKNIKAILAGILSGVLTSLTVVLALALIFNLNHKMYVTLLPKSITTAIGMGVSEELGGAVTITVAVIIITGVLGNMLAETLCKLFHIEEPIAKGISIGSASHDRYGEGHGDGRCRGRDEQPFDCSCRYSDCGRSVDLCDVYLKTNTDKKQKKSGNGKQCKTFRSRIFYP